MPKTKFKNKRIGNVRENPNDKRLSVKKTIIHPNIKNILAITAKTTSTLTKKNLKLFKPNNSQFLKKCYLPLITQI